MGVFAGVGGDSINWGSFLWVSCNNISFVVYVWAPDWAF